MSAVSSPKKTLLLRPSRAQVDSMLCVLDDAIADKADYQARRIARVDSLVKATSMKHGQERIKAMKDAYSYCSHVSGKRSMDILEKMTVLPEYKTDKNLQLWVLDSRAYIYSVMGMYHRSFALLRNLNIKDYDRPTRMHHYEVVSSMLSWMENAFCIEGALLPNEEAIMHSYTDSLLASNRDAISMAFTEVNHYIFNKAYDKALEKLVALYPKTSGQNETYVYASLCDVFTSKRDTTALTYYLAKTSFCDIEAGTTEYMGLPILVQTLFEKGDIERAYHYMQCCLDDAYLYPSQYLISQTTNLFPIIDKEYQQKKAAYEKSQRDMMILGFCLVLLFFVLMGLSIFMHHRKLMMNELKNANDRLLKTNEDLARANDVKNIFLRNMTHEIHTPMNAIDGFAQVLDASDGLIDDASRKEMIKAIRGSSHNLNMLIDNVIMLTEYEKTPVETKTNRIKVSDIFDKLNQIVYNSTEGKVDVIYHNNIPDDFSFVSSEVHIVTILNNLIDNALKFTHEGNVTTTAYLTADNKVVFSVSDTGMGIPKDKVEYIFDRFSKLNEFAQGVGLGLPLCHTLTTMLNGTICVEKSDCNGTTISVTLPSIS